MFKLFVYGTLRKNFGNHDFLKNSTFLGNAVTVPNTLLFGTVIPFMKYINLKDFEYLNIDSHVKGEVYLVSKTELENIDILEGHPDFYKREKILVNLNNKEEYIYSYIYYDDVNTEYIYNDYRKHYKENLLKGEIKYVIK